MTPGLADGPALLTQIDVLEMAAVLFCQALHEGGFFSHWPKSELDRMNGRSAARPSTDLGELSGRYCGMTTIV